VSGPRIAITGAASGIGAATAAELRSRGARVVGLDVQAAGTDVIACDVRDQRSVDRAMAEAVEHLGGGLDVLINNAGVGFSQSAGELPDERALAVVDVNALGPWRCTAAALPALREARGRVVNVASGLAHLTLPFATAYCMSKRALVAYSDALRLEHGDAITVTTVYPGYVRTPIHATSQQDGFALDGLVPVEDVRDAARTLARAALGPPVRDLATTRRGGVGYALLRPAPRRLVDRATNAVLRRYARRGAFDRSTMARAYAERLRARPARTS
jgi:NAD(P)-dependent dehydrogenase (short-subunit alcohol dehydrogenase family)